MEQGSGFPATGRCICTEKGQNIMTYISHHFLLAAPHSLTSTSAFLVPKCLPSPASSASPGSRSRIPSVWCCSEGNQWWSRELCSALPHSSLSAAVILQLSQTTFQTTPASSSLDVTAFSMNPVAFVYRFVNTRIELQS